MNENEIDVHRLRIGSFLPRPIKAIAVDSIYSHKVALGREDGEIEILDPNSNFLPQAKIPGITDFKLQALSWAAHNDEVRLFGISLKGFLFEVDLERLAILNIEDVYGGAAWCLAPSPREPILAVGSESGIIRLFRYYSLKGLEYSKAISTSSARILSVAYHPNEPKLFTGSNDGTIRCIDEVTHQTIFRMTGDIVPKVSLPCIWSLVVLDDSTVVSGDSLGQVQIWDGKMGVLQQTLGHHLGDVLALVSSHSTAVFSSGVDGKVNCFRRSSEQEKSGVWFLNQSHRLHSHDVFSIALFHNEYLLSGGLDSKLCFYGADRFDSLKPFWLPLVRGNELVSASDHFSSVLLRYHRHVDIWRTGLGSEREKNGELTTSSCRLALRLNSSDDHHLSLGLLSHSGSLALLAGKSFLKAFRLGQGQTVQELAVSNDLRANQRTITAAVFTSDDRQVLAWDSWGRQFLQLQINQAANQLELFATHPLESDGLSSSSNPADRKFSAQVRKLAVSPSSSLLAALSCAQVVTVFSLKKFVRRWTLPVSSHMVADISFLSENLFAVLTCSGQFSLYDVEGMRLVSQTVFKLDRQLSSISQIYSFSGITANLGDMSASPQCCYGPMHSVLFSVHRDQKPAADGAAKSKGKKRKLSQGDAEEANDAAAYSVQSMAQLEQYRNVLAMGSAANGSLVIVENPWTNLQDQFPDVISRKRYGT